VQTVSNPLNQVTTYSPDCNTGLVLSVTDPNQLTTTYTYDSMWRLATATYPNGEVDSITHQETTPPFTATLTRTITSSQNYIKTNQFDGLGRLSQTELVSDPENPIYTATVYDPLGRVGTVYNLTRCNPPTTNCGTEPTWGYTTYTYDALNRKTLVTEPDTSTISTSYTGGCTTVTDEAGKNRQSCTDGLAA